MKKDSKYFSTLFFVIFIMEIIFFPLCGNAKAVTCVRMKTNISMKKLTPSLQKKISSSTKKEKKSSDLLLIHPATRVSTARLLQGYTHDEKYYYFLSQLANQGIHKNDLRLTRVKYKGFRKYSESYMTLKQFGHGTTLDCSKQDGATYLWTGSDAVDAKGGTTSISCFSFRAGATLRKHGDIRYRIPVAGSKKRYASNCFPAVSEDSSLLAVRYTNGGGQHFQIYPLKNGTKITPGKAKKTVYIKSTPGTFQGFDIRGTTIYTIEGTARKSEMKELGRASDYDPIKIRSYNYKTKKKKTFAVRGAKKLTHREPEGIQVDADGKMELMLVSHYKELYSCANIYQLKSK